MEDTINPKISVLIVTYNQDSYIRETIDSVIRQGYNNLEIVIADDHSRDNTPKIVEEYRKSYPNLIVPVFNSVNLGITANCNNGLSVCSGEFISLLGGDDVFYPGKLKAQIKLMVENPECNLSFHPVHLFNSDSGKITNTICLGLLSRQVEEYFSEGNFTHASSIMVRKSASPAHGFDIRLPLVSDWLFNIETAIGGPVLRLDRVYGGYRRHGNNVSCGSILYDCLKTMEIVSERFPQYQSLIAKGKAWSYTMEVSRLIKLNDLTGARKVLWDAIKDAPSEIKLWRWFLASFLGLNMMRMSFSLWKRYVLSQKTYPPKQEEVQELYSDYLDGSTKSILEQ